MITKYNEFKKMNEGIIGDALKGLFKGLVNDIKDDFKKPLEEFTKKASNTKDPKEMKKIVQSYLKDNYDTLNKTLEEAKTPLGIYNVVNDNLKAIYATISGIKNTISDFNFEDVFKDVSDSNIKKLFTKGSKYFDKNIDSFTKNILMSWNKDIKEEDLNKEESEKKDIQNTQQEENTQENKDYSKLRKDIKNWFDLTIYSNIKKNLDNEINDNSDKSLNIEDNINNNNLKNKEGIKKIINKISEIDNPKEMAKLRDTLIELGYDGDYGLF